MSVQLERSALNVESATLDESLLADWAQELFKSSIKLANDVLVHMITIANILLSASLAFLEKIGVSKTLQAPIFILLLSVIIISVIGILPLQAHIDIHDPDTLRQFRNKILKKKRLTLMTNTFLLVGSFLCAIIGIFAR